MPCNVAYDYRLPVLALCFAAIAIKESAHVGDKNAKRLARGVDDLGKGHFTRLVFLSKELHSDPN